jgi:hypothetical protein
MIAEFRSHEEEGYNEKAEFAGQQKVANHWRANMGHPDKEKEISDLKFERRKRKREE